MMRLPLAKCWNPAVLVLVGALWVLPASAGPVILGGDDLTDHGSVSGGVNLEGWLYIEKAITNILSPASNITRPGHIPGRIAALGSAPSIATNDDAGAAIGSAALAAGFTVDYYEGAAAINQFFVDLASGAVDPAMLWIAGTGSDNDIDSAEGAALTANASAIAAFVNTGGGLMAHGSGTDAYGWLPVVLPGLANVLGCTTTGAFLTPAGQAAFPGLTNADITAGPCHSTFSGNLGSLKVLAFDGAGGNFIIGGGSGTVIGPAKAAAIPTLSEWGMLVMASLLALGAMLQLRKRRR